jgi:predicted Co/Zn/Cd cation transporter (cation efflux family)
MDGVRLEDTIYGVLLAVVAAVALIVVLVELSRRSTTRDSEVISISGGFALMCAIFSLVLLTGWINILPLPR